MWLNQVRVRHSPAGPPGALQPLPKAPPVIRRSPIQRPLADPAKASARRPREKSHSRFQNPPTRGDATAGNANRARCDTPPPRVAEPQPLSAVNGCQPCSPELDKTDVTAKIPPLSQLLAAQSCLDVAHFNFDPSNNPRYTQRRQATHCPPGTGQAP